MVSVWLVSEYFLLGRAHPKRMVGGPGLRPQLLAGFLSLAGVRFSTQASVYSPVNRAQSCCPGLLGV